jgi:hypothetical protein
MVKEPPSRPARASRGCADDVPRCCLQAQPVKNPETGEIQDVPDDIRQQIADDYVLIKRDTEAQVNPDLGTFDHKFFRGDR